MLTKEELLKNYEELKNYWLSAGAEYLFGKSKVEFMKEYNIDIDKELIDNSDRYWAIKKIGYILYNYKDYEKRINKFVGNLQGKWWNIWNKSFQRIEKEACHWKREGFESKEEYKEYLHDTVCDPGYWNSDKAWEASTIENQLSDISKITEEYYELSY